MSKRLSDSEVWKKAWFYDLDAKYKLFWFYILSDCDAAGIWAVNFRLAENIIGVKYDIQVLIEKLKSQIAVLNGGNYWFIVDFIKFQYGYPVSETAKMRKKLIDLLSLRGINLDTLYEEINTVSIQYQYSINTVKVKDKDIIKDKIVKDSAIYTEDFETFWKNYPNAVAKKKSFEAWQKAEDKPSISIILEKLTHQKQTDQWKKDNGQFIPMSTTYINQGRWHDEIKKPGIIRPAFQQ